MLGLKTALPTRLPYRIGACAAAMLATTLALPAVVDVASAGAEEAPAEDIADRLVSSVGVVLVVGGPDDSVAVLRQIAQDQAALTPPTAAAAEDGDTTAYTLGRVAFLLVMVGVPAWLIVRAVRHRRRPGPGLPDPTASPGDYPYSPSRPGIPLPPLESSSEAPRPPRPSDGGYSPRRSGIPLPPLESSSEAPPAPRPSDGGFPPRRPGIPLPPLEPGSER